MGDDAVEGWRSKAGWAGKAHYVLADGTTACGDRGGPWGEPMSALFKTAWSPLREADHLCGWCRKLHPRPCLCGLCRVAPAPKRSSAT